MRIIGVAIVLFIVASLALGMDVVFSSSERKLIRTYVLEDQNTDEGAQALDFMTKRSEKRDSGVGRFIRIHLVRNSCKAYLGKGSTHQDFYMMEKLLTEEDIPFLLLLLKTEKDPYYVFWTTRLLTKITGYDDWMVTEDDQESRTRNVVLFCDWYGRNFDVLPLAGSTK